MATTKNVTIPHTGTEYTANAITLTRGTVADIVAVGVYHSTDPNVVPARSDFVEVLLVKPGDPLADNGFTDIVALIGPRGGDVTLAAGDWQRWCLVSTGTEDIIRKVDVVTVL